MLTLVGAVAEFERTLILERQREGVAAAKLAGKYVGRQPTARAKYVQVAELADVGMSRANIAVKLYISVASVYRALALVGLHDALARPGRGGR